MFAIARCPTPVLNTPNFSGAFGGPDGSTLDVDKKIELVALKGTKFKILDEKGGICRVHTKEYTSDPLYVASEFLQKCAEEPPERDTKLPSKKQLLANLEKILKRNLPYLWGGNWSQGIPELLKFYPPKKADPKANSLWMLQGVDCTGLLYEATEGATPRNSSDLVNYKTAVAVAGLNPVQLAAVLQPTDLIVWPGHIVIVFDEKTTIESRGGRGCITTPLIERLEEIFKDRTSVNDWSPVIDPKKHFTIRRLFEE